jgi:hypothetical protein
MKVCITCQSDVSAKTAYPIKEDRIIRTIRAVKKTLGIAQMNELYVCKDCLGKHAERRKSFEKSMLFSSVFAGLILVVLLAAIVLSGRFDAWAIVSAFIVAGFILALPVFRYAPAVEAPPVSAAPAVPAITPPPAAPAAPQPPAGQKAEKRKRKRSKS